MTGKVGIASIGSAFWFYDNEAQAVVKLKCPKNFELDPGTTGKEDGDTCLESGVSESNIGVTTPGQASYAIPFDPRVTSHSLLYKLFKNKKEVDFVFGFSNSKDEPTYDGTSWTLPGTRDWFTFRGFFSNVPISAEPGSTVQSTVTVELLQVPELVESGSSS